MNINKQRPYLAVIFSHPRYGNFQHWALHLHTSTEDLIFEVDGEHPNFQKVTSRGWPADEPTFIESVVVSDIGEPDIPTVQTIVAQTLVDNETLEWDCQEYVLDILDGCQREAVLDDADEEYREVRAMLQDRRGPML